MDKSINPAKSGVLLGVLFGAIMVLEFVILFLIGIKSLLESNAKSIIDVANYLVLPLLFIYLACNNFKHKLNNGFISLTESIKIGVTMMLIAAIIYALFNIVFNLIFPEFLGEMIGLLKSVLVAKSPNLQPKELEMKIAMLKKVMDPYVAFPITLAIFSSIGLIYAVLIGLIVKKERS